MSGVDGSGSECRRRPEIITHRRCGRLPRYGGPSRLRLERLGVSISIVPRLFEGLPDRVVLEPFGALPLVQHLPHHRAGWQTAVKYELDRVIASVAIVVLSPLLLIAAADLLASSGWPLLFRQRRVGLDRREFDMFEFMTNAGSTG